MFFPSGVTLDISAVLGQVSCSRGVDQHIMDATDVFVCFIWLQLGVFFFQSGGVLYCFLVLESSVVVLGSCIFAFVKRLKVGLIRSGRGS